MFDDVQFWATKNLTVTLPAGTLGTLASPSFLPVPPYEKSSIASGLHEK